MAKEQFFYDENRQHLELLEAVTHRSGVSRGQAFEDLLEMGVCALSGGTMEEDYLKVVARHAEGANGKRGVDALGELFGRLVASMETTREGIRDVLGDLFVGAISYGEASQYFTPEPVCRAMARLTIGALADEESADRRRVSDPACGSGRMLLAAAEIDRGWEFIGQDVDLRCVRMTAINLALRNLYGHVVWGNTLANEQRAVFRTGFNGRGFLRTTTLSRCPEHVQQTAAEAPPQDDSPKSQLHLF